MTVDERLQQAWSDVQQLPITTPAAETVVRRRQRVGRAARATFAALVLVIAVFGAIAVRNDNGTTVTASDVRDRDRSLLDASDLGRGWITATDATTNTSSPCGSHVLDQFSWGPDGHPELCKRRHGGASRARAAGLPRWE